MKAPQVKRKCINWAAQLQATAWCCSAGAAEASSGGACGASVQAWCPTPECCSQYGWCGVTSAHCGTGCQQSYGSCTRVGKTVSRVGCSRLCSLTVGSATHAKLLHPMATAAVSPSPPPKPPSPSPKPPASSGGACGASIQTQCPTSECCSQYNYCGNTSAHCGTGCQITWGYCVIGGECQQRARRVYDTGSLDCHPPYDCTCLISSLVAVASTSQLATYVIRNLQALELGLA